MSVCQGCGAELVLSTRRPRKWCSERCRKGQYAGICVDCGTATNGYDGPGKASKRCIACHERYQITRPGLERAEEKAAQAHPVRITVDACVAAIRQVAGDRRSLSHDAYQAERDSGLPSYPTICVRVGSWNEAVRLAGLTPTREPQGYRRITADDCAAAIRRVAEDCGNLPSYAEYCAYRKLEDPSLPSGPLIRIRCDTWVQALRMAAALDSHQVAA